MSVKRQEDPAEGSREVVEHELERQEDKRKDAENDRDRSRSENGASQETGRPRRSRP